MNIKSLRKKILSIVIFACLLLASFAFMFVEESPVNALMAGSGTLEDPYIITTTVEEFQSINNNLGAYYELGNDIDATATSGWNGGRGFISIGNVAYFTGQLDGNSHLISGLYQRDTSFGHAVIFNQNSGVIKDIGFVNVSLQETVDAGRVAFINVNGGTITNCYINGSMNGIYRTSGFCIWNGGYGIIANCSSRQDIIVGWYAVGFCWDNYGLIEQCWSFGNVSSFEGSGGWASGFIGMNRETGVVTDCYSGDTTNVVHGNTYASGFCAQNEGIISNCYSNGIATCDATSDGFCCYETVGSTIVSCYWDTETSGCLTSHGGTGKTTAQMKQQSTFSGWDFLTPIWYITEGVRYPDFINRDLPPTPPSPPSDLIATANSSSKMFLTWTKADGVTGTAVRRSLSAYPATTDSGTLVYMGSASSAYDSNLSSATRYYYRAWSYVNGSIVYSTLFDDAYATTLYPGTYSGGNESVIVIDIPMEDWYGNYSCAGNIPMREEFLKAAQKIGCSPCVLIIGVVAALSTGISVSIFLFSGSLVFAFLAGLIVLVGGYWVGALPVWILMIYFLLGISIYFVLRRA